MNKSKIDPPKLENFERAFTSGSSGCRRTCECGREFWDSYNEGYDWEPGEVEELKNNPNATSVAYSVSSIILEGKEYPMDCDCWHKRAEQIMGLIDGHDHAIARYLTLEKQRKQAIADKAPVVEEGKDDYEKRS